MDVTPLVKSGTQIIQGYSDGGFNISGQRYEGGVIVSGGQTAPWNAPKSVADLKISDFETIIADADNIDVVLLGCGAAIAFLAQDLKNALKDKGLSVDVMDTGAACRTFNVLIAEGRRVAVCLFPAS